VTGTKVRLVVPVNSEFSRMEVLLKDTDFSVGKSVSAIKFPVTTMSGNPSVLMSAKRIRPGLKASEGCSPLKCAPFIVFLNMLFKLSRRTLEDSVWKGIVGNKGFWAAKTLVGRASKQRLSALVSAALI